MGGRSKDNKHATTCEDKERLEGRTDIDGDKHSLIRGMECHPQRTGIKDQGSQHGNPSTYYTVLCRPR